MVIQSERADSGEIHRCGGKDGRFAGVSSGGFCRFAFFRGLGGYFSLFYFCCCIKIITFAPVIANLAQLVEQRIRNA